MRPKSLLLKLALLVFVLFLLCGCGAIGQSGDTPLPTVALDQGNTTDQPSPQATGREVIASGVVVPAEQAQLAFGLGGRVEALDVAVGEAVTAGQALARLEGQENLEATVSQAQFELEQAQQALDDLATQAETGRVQAMQQIVTYERDLRDAQYALDNFTVPSNQAGLDAVEALNLMEKRLDEARLAFQPYRYKSESDPVREDFKEALDLAQAAYNTAVRRLEMEYDLAVARAQLDTALQDYEILKSGPDPDKARLAEARLVNAQNQLAAAQAALEHLTLAAPFSGTVAGINFHSGEWVLPGQPILILSDLDRLQVETTDLSERDIPQIEIGQPVTVFIEALNQSVTGTVREISPVAETLGGDVVYKVTIELDAQPQGLREGMSVEVTFKT